MSNQQPFKIDVSQRISRLPPYLFGRINKMKYEKRVAGVDIIDLGMGNPTDPTPECVVSKLAEAALDPRNHRYSVSNGIAGLRKEVAVKYKQKYGVELDPETEVIATIGSKEGFSHLCLAMLGPGDTAVVAGCVALRSRSNCICFRICSRSLIVASRFSSFSCHCFFKSGSVMTRFFTASLASC